MMVNKVEKSARYSALIFHLNCDSVNDYFPTGVCLIAGNNLTLLTLVSTPARVGKVRQGLQR